MATAHLAMPFLQKDNKKSSSNQQIPENFLKLLSKNGGKRKKKKNVNFDVHKPEVFPVY